MTHYADAALRWRYYSAAAADDVDFVLVVSALPVVLLHVFTFPALVHVALDLLM